MVLWQGNRQFPKGWNIFPRLPMLMILLIGAAYTVMGFYMPAVGDDLNFYYTFAEQNDTWYSLPRFMYRHWLWNNARLADMLMPIGLYMFPLWAKALTQGVITALLFYFILKLALNKISDSLFASIFLIAIIAFGMRWDGIWMEYNTFSNYICSATLGLFAIYLLLQKPPKSRRWYWGAAIPVCFIAGAMHEAEGFPLTVGATLYLFLSDFFNRQNIFGRLMILALIAGGVFTLTSPASYSRVGAMLQPENPLTILFGSAWCVVILTLLILWFAFCKRDLLKELVHSPWIIFATAAFVSTAFMLLSQFGGRTGWFAQIFALIAIFRMLSTFKFKLQRPLAMPIIALLSAAIIFHFVSLTIWQIKLGTETRQAIALYKTSPDGVIFMDYTNEPELPWYLLRKTHGVPDDDDSYYRYRMAKHYGHGKPLIILPQAWERANLGNQHIEARNQNNPGDKHLHLEARGFILTSEPLGKTYEDKIVDIFPRRMIRINGTEYIETRFTHNGRPLFLYSPVDRDRGEK